MTKAGPRKASRKTTAKPRERTRRSATARWTPTLRRLRALSVRQPWAWLIVNGFKDVENRSWPTRHRGPLLIHAGVNKSELSEARLEALEATYGVRLPRDFEIGGVVGIVDVIDCKRRPDSVWHIRGQVGWVLARPRRLKFREAKGLLGLFVPRFGR